MLGGSPSEELSSIRQRDLRSLGLWCRGSEVGGNGHRAQLLQGIKQGTEKCLLSLETKRPL